MEWEAVCEDDATSDDECNKDKNYELKAINISLLTELAIANIASRKIGGADSTRIFISSTVNT